MISLQPFKVKVSLQTVTPDKTSSEGKKKQLEKMFDSISGRYDFLNHFLSMGIDRRWRKKLIEKLKPFKPAHILDMATGTGDLAFEALSLNPEKITGIDLSEGMLSRARKKIPSTAHAIFEFQKGYSESIEFESDYFDACTVGFGVRNFEDLQAGLKEIYRVLKPGAPLAILEFSIPSNFPVKQLYYFYFHAILPFFVRFISRNNKAYRYLPESVRHFPDGKAFLKILSEAGFTKIGYKPLSFGICSIYTGIK
jgi:demethylmenaquinone methyltransferase/2-methoxy-6-polyprenyl-1,4-benzoquinol methylase